MESENVGLTDLLAGLEAEREAISPRWIPAIICLVLCFSVQDFY